MYNLEEYHDVLGKTLAKVQNNDDEIVFTFDDGDKYKMMHHQDCCESVYVEDIVGDLEDLIGHPLREAEEVSFNSPEELDSKTRMWAALTTTDNDHRGEESETWTYYKLGTIKGSVSIRWYGSSNGYYSESVSFFKIE